MPLEQTQNLDRALKYFTLCLGDPCVPGELEVWIKAVSEALSGLNAAIRHHISQNHQEQFARITEEDSEMFHQVALLKKEDRNILQQIESLVGRTRKLAERVPRVESNEAQVHEELSGLITEGLAFAVQVQRQEIAIRTWFQEAFLRERGVAD